jgi:UDP-3-O-[3-hydroxymyristoyl] glucosamine N-acyltransferase
MFTLSHIAKLVGGEVIGDERLTITGIAAADSAGKGDLTFAEKESYFAAAEQSLATAVLVPSGFALSAKSLIRVKDPRFALAQVLALFFPPETYEPGIHPSSVVHPTAQIDPSAYVGPHCIIESGVRLGQRTVLIGNNTLGHGTHIGDDACLHASVVIYAKGQVGNRVTIHAGTVIGSDGYGYVFNQGRHHKMIQIGNVVIGDDVEIGANVAIDRGALGSTKIGSGTKIDNLVHIAHNVVIGNHCLVMGQVGFAGSTRLGNYVVVASQSGIAGHLKIGNQATIGAKSGVMRDIPDGETVLGYPAAPDKQAKRQWIAVGQLPDVIRRLRTLEKQPSGSY